MFSFLVTPRVMALLLFGIYGAKSKGVWLAVGLTGDEGAGLGLPICVRHGLSLQLANCKNGLSFVVTVVSPIPVA